MLRVLIANCSCSITLKPTRETYATEGFGDMRFLPHDRVRGGDVGDADVPDRGDRVLVQSFAEVAPADDGRRRGRRRAPGSPVTEQPSQNDAQERNKKLTGGREKQEEACRCREPHRRP